MINSLCGSMVPVATDSSSRQPLSPTASVSESNVTGDLDAVSPVQPNGYNIIPGVMHSEPEEVHSFDSSIWDTIFSEVMMESPADMMISSPARVAPAIPITCCYTSDFSDDVHESENQSILDAPLLPFLSSSRYNDSFSFNHKPNKLHHDQKITSQLVAGPPISKTMTANSRHYSDLGVQIKPADVSSSLIFGHEQSMNNENTLPKVLSAPQLTVQNDQSLRSRIGTPNVPPPVNIIHARRSSIDQNNERFGYNFPTSPTPCTSPTALPHTPTLSHSPASMLDYQQLSSPNPNPNPNISRSNGNILHNSGLPSHMNFQQSMYPVHQQKLDITTATSPQAVDAQDSGLQLVHLLLACAEAVARDDYMVAHRTLVQLKQVVSPLGDSMQRVASCFTEALHVRLMGTGGRPYASLRAIDLASSEEVMNAYQILYQACPYIKFAHFTANQAIFEAFDGEERVHIIDLDIIQGYQWPAFVQALAARPGGAPHLRITGVGTSLEAVQETGKRLAELAESLHVPFEFHPVGERLENLQAHMFQRRIGEALAVNSVNRLHRLLSESTSSVSALLSMIRDQAPNIVTLVEQEASHNGPFFLGRFLEALHYYSAIFDSLDATLPQNNPERAKVEQLIFAAEICNIVACEGPGRFERHEKLEKWRKVMESKGFQNVPLSANAVNQSKLLLGLYPCDGYRLTEEKGCLLLGWQDRSLIAASAWHC